ncbi:hypothetical protein, partial [uncultured Helicobacter sp.]|uniref:hypothetical protein n=1 Tax=uncultured Helicobacter sp. TaxID=175537 RepID=UPI0037510294
RFFAALRLQPVGSFSAIGGGGESLAFPLLAQSLRRALLPPCSNDCTPQSGRDSGCSAQDNVTGKPSVECKENTESKAFIESSSCRV